MNASWPNESTKEVEEYTPEEDAQMLREADELQRKRWGKQPNRQAEAIDEAKLRDITGQQ